MWCDVVVVGGGPAGLMAAEAASAAGLSVRLFDAMPSVGRKFLLAGLGGLNLTHAEPLEAFVSRFGARAPECGAWLSVLGPQGVRDWAAGLGVDTFVGSSQRVFPVDMKAAPLLRAWLHRLRGGQGSGGAVAFHMRHRWLGGCEPVALDGGGTGYALAFDSPQGQVVAQARAVVLALGGGSWPRLGSDGAWQPWLGGWGVTVLPLRPANCGFDVEGRAGLTGWSEFVASRLAGQPLKGVALSFVDVQGQAFHRKGECVVTATGLEGSLIYAASARLRDTIAACGSVRVTLDWKPDWSPERVLAEVSRPRGGRSLSSHLKGRLGLSAVQVALLHEVLEPAALKDASTLSACIKALPLTLVAPRPLDEAISSAGGVALEALTPGLMLRDRPGVFCAGEMLDWEAPTGGYLLTACLASGQVAGQAVVAYLHTPQQA